MSDSYKPARAGSPRLDAVHPAEATMATHPDIFTNVHKGIRAALFEACIRLGRAGDADPDLPETLAFAASALHFVSHHGENEDLLLLPLLAKRCPHIAQWMAGAHGEMDARIAALREALGSRPIESLYLDFTSFTAVYLAHMHDEEQMDGALRDFLDEEEIASIGRQSVARTSPADQQLMLGFMLPAMPPPAARAMLANLPPGLAANLSPLLDRQRR